MSSVRARPDPPFRVWDASQFRLLPSITCLTPRLSAFAILLNSPKSMRYSVCLERHCGQLVGNYTCTRGNGIVSSSSSPYSNGQPSDGETHTTPPVSGANNGQHQQAPGSADGVWTSGGAQWQSEGAQSPYASSNASTPGQQPPQYQQPYGSPSGPTMYPQENPYRIQPPAAGNETCLGCGSMGCLFGVILFSCVILIFVMIWILGGAMWAIR